MKQEPINSSENICLSSKHNAVLLICGKKLQWSDIVKIGKEVQGVVRKHENTSDSFVGSCFGYYDVSIEIEGKSAKVLSNCACQLQKRIVNILKSGEAAVCSSLIIGNKITKCDLIDKKSELPIRAYTFMRPKKDVNINFKELLNQLPSESSLFWNPSIFSILMVTEGSSHNEIFRNILRFRKNNKIKKEIAEGSTLFALKYDYNADRCRSLEEDCSEKVAAVVAIKLRKYISPNELNSKLNKVGGRWVALLDSKFDKVFYRAGGADFALGIVADSLNDLRLKTFALRKELKEKIYTSTILFLPGGGVLID